MNNLIANGYYQNYLNQTIRENILLLMNLSKSDLKELFKGTSLEKIDLDKINSQLNNFITKNNRKFVNREQAKKLFLENNLNYTFKAAQFLFKQNRFETDLFKGISNKTVKAEQIRQK